MILDDIIKRAPVPVPWEEGEKIPWDEPGFSGRMLKEHLSQAHDMASRRGEVIDRHVGWIHRTLLSGQPSKILDLGCGPGLYTSRLARLGHTCSGIDFSPASVAYANEIAAAEGLACSYARQDIRTADFGTGHDLVMLIFGEFNVFKPEEARAILAKAHGALDSGGQLLLEPHTFETVRKIGMQGPTWYTAVSGLFSEQPHLCLMENAWNSSQAVATQRYFIIDGASGKVTRHGSSMQAYSEAQYRTMIEACGFERIEMRKSLEGREPDSEIAAGLMVISARKV